MTKKKTNKEKIFNAIGISHSTWYDDCFIFSNENTSQVSVSISEKVALRNLATYLYDLGYVDGKRDGNKEKTEEIKKCLDLE